MDELNARSPPPRANRRAEIFITSAVLTTKSVIRAKPHGVSRSRRGASRNKKPVSGRRTAVVHGFLGNYYTGSCRSYDRERPVYRFARAVHARSRLYQEHRGFSKARRR